MSEEENYIPPDSLASTFLTAGDIPYEKQKQEWLWFSSLLRGANITRKERDDLLDDFDILRIEKINGGRRGENCHSRSDYVEMRSYILLGSSLSIDALSLKQLAGQHKSIEYKDLQSGNPGVLGSLGSALKKGGQSNNG
jgi:hypothetical protein